VTGTLSELSLAPHLPPRVPASTQRGTVPLPRSTTLARVEENLAGSLGLGGPGWSLSSEDMALIDGLDAGSAAGRIMKGDNFAAEGEPWTAVWDEDWEGE
jgi:hypothetical protein